MNMLAASKRFINLVDKSFLRCKLREASTYNVKFKVIIALGTVLLIAFTFCLPKPLFTDPSSTVIEDRNHHLLSAQIATDGQWRFPLCDSLPNKFEKCILLFEDEYFYYHPGINPFSLAKAIIQNFKENKTVRGGSTITAQVIRLSRKGKKRNIGQKSIEFIQALRLELRSSKKEILALYASHAPFGGNVVGLEAAAWRYYGREPGKLSWGETATLAVLPNAPSLIFPGKNHELLRQKRNRLLNKLYKKNIIDSLTCALAKAELLPQKPKPLPQIVPHLLTRAINDNKAGSRIASSIDKEIQEAANQIINNHFQVLSQNGIMNAAALIADIGTGEVLCYVGNTTSKKNDAGNFVDIIPAPRSTGSTLKPFLYALMQKEGLILPQTLLPDVPTQMGGYTPKNFNYRYDGAVHANNALARSLNIPAVHMLKMYGIELFTDQIKTLQIKSIDKPANHYGLSLILGGAEISLWELAGTYASMARVLNHYPMLNSMYSAADYHPLSYTHSAEKKTPSNLSQSDIFGAGSIWLTFSALTEMQRPIEGTSWKLFDSSRKIAWKTGTSFGFRDAWAVGITPKYVVAVWVGNADGEGRPGLTGTRAAAPIMFDLYKQLPQTTWFETPFDDLVRMAVCKQSGYKALPICTQIDTQLISTKGERTHLCPFHKTIFLDKTKQFQVNSNCYGVNDMVAESWFILPPVMEWYYKSVDPFYKVLPPFMPGCNTSETNNMDIIYPQNNAHLFLPKGFNAEQQCLVFEVAHRLPGATLYWHLDDEYLGTTQGIHKMEVFAREGRHTLTLLDDNGETKVRSFEILSR